jgi:hypothetical protein
MQETRPLPVTPPASRIFIVGFGRSGTTLLRTILSRHSRIAITPETHFLKRAEAAGGPQGSPEDFEAFWERLTEWVRFRDLGIDPAETRALVGRDTSFRAVFDAMLEAYRSRLGAARVGEKTPSHSRYLSTLLGWYPDAQVLVLERDPRAAIASFLKTPWVRETIFEPSLRRGLTTGDPRNAIADLAAEWERLYAHEFARRADDPRLRRVRYENLVRGPEREVRGICDFLGEAFEPAMLGDEEVSPPSAAIGDARIENWRRGHERRSNAPVSADSLEKWRGILTAEQAALIEARCRRGMALTGYAREAGTPRRWLASGVAAVTAGVATLEHRARGAVSSALSGAGQS